MKRNQFRHNAVKRRIEQRRNVSLQPRHCAPYSLRSEFLLYPPLEIFPGFWPVSFGDHW